MVVRVWRRRALVAAMCNARLIIGSFRLGVYLRRPHRALVEQHRTRHTNNRLRQPYSSCASSPSSLYIIIIIVVTTEGAAAAAAAAVTATAALV